MNIDNPSTMNSQRQRSSEPTDPGSLPVPSEGRRKAKKSARTSVLDLQLVGLVSKRLKSHEHPFLETVRETPPAMAKCSRKVSARIALDVRERLLRRYAPSKTVQERHSAEASTPGRRVCLTSSRMMNLKKRRATVTTTPPPGRAASQPDTGTSVLNSPLIDERLLKLNIASASSLSSSIKVASPLVQPVATPLVKTVEAAPPLENSPIDHASSALSTPTSDTTVESSLDEFEASLRRMIEQSFLDDDEVTETIASFRDQPGAELSFIEQIIDIVVDDNDEAFEDIEMVSPDQRENQQRDNQQQQEKQQQQPVTSDISPIVGQAQAYADSDTDEDESLDISWLEKKHRYASLDITFPETPPTGGRNPASSASSVVDTPTVDGNCNLDELVDLNSSQKRRHSTTKQSERSKKICSPELQPNRFRIMSHTPAQYHPLLDPTTLHFHYIYSQFKFK